MKMIAEGVKTTASAFELAKKLDVKVPIIGEVYYILYENKSPHKAVEDLMSRDIQSELASSPLTAL